MTKGTYTDTSVTYQVFIGIYDLDPKSESDETVLHVVTTDMSSIRHEGFIVGLLNNYSFRLK